MICSFPRDWLINLVCYLEPLFGTPIKDINAVKPFFIGPSSPENDHSVIMPIVVHRTVGPMGGRISSGLYLLPFHGDGVEGPDIVHVVGVYVKMVMYRRILRNRPLRHR